MKTRTYQPIFMLAVLILSVGMACSLGSTPATTAPASPTQASKPEATQPEPVQPTLPPENASKPGAVSSRDDVETAVVRIEAKGDYVYPSDTSAGSIYDLIGSGSGFLVDPSGIAVTNNHVVTGADSLQVFFSGDPKPHNARVLGVSECSDLAVVQITGSPFPYLQWFEDPIKVGMNVWSAGYPLGDPQYSLHRGVVSKREATVPTDWAAVDSVLEHDATINPGNSGGPLIDDNGKVVGINYASSNVAVNQFFAIARQEAEPILKDLEAGKSVTSIGINGTAFVSQDGSSSGIWVYSVATGSPAYKVGIRGGDILTELEGSLIGKDGTKKDYCEILRSHNAEDALSVKVLRLSTSEILEGTLNGDKLAVVGSLSTGNTDNTNTNTNTTGSAAVTDDFSQDSGNFELFTGGQAQIVNGAFYLGKFSECADIGSNNPFGCFSTCLTCGSASTYEMAVDSTYINGVSGRTFGMVLRFVDNNGNGLVDSDDYYLDFEYSAFDGYYYVWEHRSDGKWYIIDQNYSKSIVLYSTVNHLKAVASNGGADIDIYANGDNWVTGITGIPFTEGTVGLVIGGRALQAAFDNFQFAPTQ